MLTANAPRLAKDNPFIPQVWPVEDPETGMTTMVTITPLTLLDEGRFVPAQERFIPGVAAQGVRGVREAQLAATGPQPVVVSTPDGAANDREAAVRADPPAVPAIPAAAARAAAAADEERKRQEAAQEAAQGSPPPQREVKTMPEPEETPVPVPAPVSPDSPGVRVGDETAEKVDHAVGEETGAAPPPTGEPPEGSYIASEEVGTPQAAAQPPPFTPPKE